MKVQLLLVVKLFGKERNTYRQTKHVGLAATLLQLYRGDVQFLTGFSWFTLVFSENPRIVPRLGHNRLLPCSFQFIIYHSPNSPTLYNLDSETVAK